MVVYWIGCCVWFVPDRRLYSCNIIFDFLVGLIYYLGGFVVLCFGNGFIYLGLVFCLPLLVLLPWVFWLVVVLVLVGFCGYFAC